MSKLVMLAHPYVEDKHKDKVNGWWMSIKYDGVRGFWNGNIMTSRNGLEYTLPDYITKQLKKFKNEDGTPMKLDGEIWFGNDTFAIASGAARRYENDIEVWKNMMYMVFDIPDTKLVFEDRIKLLNKTLKKLGTEIPNIRGVVHSQFKSSETTISNELLKVEENGGEGLIIRKPNSMYIFDRSHDMLKVKSWSYKEAEVISYLEGKGKYIGMVGSMEVKSDEFGDEDSDEKKMITFRVGSGLNDWQKWSGLTTKENWNKKEVQQAIDESRRKQKKTMNKNSDELFKSLNHIIDTQTGKAKIDALHKLNELYTTMPLIGDKITFRYKELTKTGSPLFPTFVGVRDYE